MEAPESLYQPVPFPDYEHIESSRTVKDCEGRFQWIKKHLIKIFGKLEGLSLIDIGCANAFFPFRFLQEGGGVAFGVERDDKVREFTKDLAAENKMKLTLVKALKELEQGKRFNVGIYFDLHGHEGINCLPWLAPRVDVLYASTAGDGNYYNPALEEELKKHFKNVGFLGVTIANRFLFACTEPLNMLTAEKTKETKPEAPAAAPTAPTAQAETSGGTDTEAPKEKKKPAKKKEKAEGEKA